MIVCRIYRLHLLGGGLLRLHSLRDQARMGLPMLLVLGRLPKGKVVARSSSNSSGPTSPVSPWPSSQVKRRLMTESNWLHGGQVLANYISPADGPVTTLCMDDKYVIIGMANSWIHIFDIGSGRLKRNLQGHSQGVWALAVVSKNPIAASMYTSPPTQSSSSSEARSSSSMGMGTDEGTHGRRASMTPGSAAEFGLLPGLGIIGQPRRPSTATGYGHNKAPREARKMKSSDQCGAAMGWPGLRRDLVVSGGSDRALRVWDINTG
jgi:F-box and WD-40 domain protein CDC4